MPGTPREVDLAETVYALDAATIELCLPLFPCDKFCTTNAAVKLHTLLDLRAAIPSLLHISDVNLHDVKTRHATESESHLRKNSFVSAP